VIAYLDSSALLRLVLREPGGLEQRRATETLVSSELLAVECPRTIDRLRLQGALSLATHDDDLALAARAFGIEAPGA
jgi:predicted nucleic acid-binding protein